MLDLMGMRFTEPTRDAKRRARSAVPGGLMAALAALLVAGCSLAPTASLGGDTAGDRGTIRVLFINNTAQTAVFTAGTFDLLDEFTAPTIVQFGFSDAAVTLPPESESAIGSLPCARVFSVGGSRLLTLVGANADATSLVPESTIFGVDFYTEAEDDATAAPVAVGSSAAFDTQLGVDFACGALLIVRFEINDVGDAPFRVDFDLIPASSTR